MIIENQFVCSQKFYSAISISAFIFFFLLIANVNWNGDAYKKSSKEITAKSKINIALKLKLN